ncbi:sensor histidine kinase [Subdoligranulum variabile]|uniref:histidine kinase n=1 Tax=Subdoligranulum variabile DSM 15176 TaxID=411471 RepID=D1PI48_9FIRM|nr:HAMP domain-containing sensor histidine kinase [Subdoligranulum variabile]EFB77628.1 ATPase/histidine kinase/DNA gyrase B/HSP90 domain protein [Subdoligranulum variabile DSM 15176]UWP69285.1 HAMP domain-containing histidine kinase [Subdoligranulum variabile]
MKRLSITLRVTLLYAVFMVLLAGLSLGFLFHAGAQSARQATLDRMQTMAEDSRKELEAKDGELEIDRDLEAFDDGVYLSLYDTAGVPLYGFVPRAFDNSVIFDDASLRTVESGGRTWYLYDEQITVEDYGPVWVRSIAAADAVDSTLGTLWRAALLVLPVFVVLAAVCGYLLTRRAFAPVRQITQTAREIGAGNDLSRRIGLTGRRDEIYTLAAEFDAMFARLEEAFDREKQFTDDASHELRTPTAVILSQSEYALENTDPRGETRAALESIHAQAARMASLLSQLLMLARADKGRQVVQQENVDLSELAGIVAETEAEQAAARNITVETDLEPGVTVQGDETLLMRLLINLTENAIHYGRPGGHVRLTLRRQDGEAVGTVEDDGIGIAAEDQDKIWQRFWQADPARSGGGAGLGLSMVRWIAEAHGGRVTVQSRPGKGSVFTFCIPCEKSEKV